MRDFHPALPVAVAFSGGADSTALLLACVDRWPDQVVAVHVNHGLQTAAADFEQHCRTVCEQLHVPLQVLRVDARHSAGQSPEDAARQARYKAFGALAPMESAQNAIKSVAIAQHADDQIETLLLALSRGSGLAGLSGMPAQWQRDGLVFHRPLLSVSSADIRAWLAGRNGPFIEDPTNQDQRFTRNRIRAQLVPALQSCFPQFRDTFSRSAMHAAQAHALLEEIAEQDFASVARSSDGLPVIKLLQKLGHARQANVLRYWLKSSYQAVPSTAQLSELMNQLVACTTRGHSIHIKVGRGYVRRIKEVLTWYNP